MAQWSESADYTDPAATGLVYLFYWVDPSLWSVSRPFWRGQTPFQVAITGTVKDDVLTLDERFVYDDGEQEQRIWSIKRLGDNRYSGTAADVIGEAVGHSAGSVFSWRYTLDLPYKDSSIAVKFDDWMFLQSDGVMLNRAQVSKWGFNVGEVTLFFSKAQL